MHKSHKINIICEIIYYNISYLNLLWSSFDLFLNRYQRSFNNYYAIFGQNWKKLTFEL